MFFKYFPPFAALSMLADSYSIPKPRPLNLNNKSDFNKVTTVSRRLELENKRLEIEKARVEAARLKMERKQKRKLGLTN